MEFRPGTESYYRKMLELQDKLRKSEEERLKLEEKFNEIMQQSRDAEHERLRILRHKYHKFLEEDKMRQERNENILRIVDRIDSRAKQLAAKTDRFKAFRKQYFENYLKQIPKQKQQTFELNTQPINRPQYQNENIRRNLFADQPTTVNENVETKLALLEQYLRDNFDNFPRDFPTSTIKQNGIYNGKQTNVLYDNKNYLDDASDSKESQEIEVDRYSPSKINGYQKESESLGNRIEQELDRLRNKKDIELNNNMLDVQEINPEQVINDYKKLVTKSEEKYGLKNGLQNGIPKTTEDFENIDEENQSHKDIPLNVDGNEEIKSDLLEEEANSEDTKPPTDISLNLSSTSQLKDLDDSKGNQIEISPQINNEEYLENSSKSEEITSIEKQKIQSVDLQRKQSNTDTKPILNQFEEIAKNLTASDNEEQQNVVYDPNLVTSNYTEQENIHSDEKLKSNEFEESVSNQQYSKEQEYPPEISEEYQGVQLEEYSEQQYVEPQDEIEEQYNKGQPDYENSIPQNDTEGVYNEQQYVNSQEQYANSQGEYAKVEEQYVNPEQQYQNAELYENTEYKNSEPQLEVPEKQYPEAEQYTNPEEQYEISDQQYLNQEQYVNPEQQYEPTEQQYEPTEQQYVNPEQQEYPPENYEQQYTQQVYPEGEYDPQNYPQEYDSQQPENYDAQNYPQQQYTEGYGPQQYTQEQQLEYDQQYAQGEGYQDQQFVENTGEYNSQGQYSENLYQTGQEYLQGEQNVDLQYETEQQQEYPDGYVEQEIEENIAKGQINETVTESDEISTVSEQKQLEDNKPLVQKKLPNLADMLDTDTSESVKPDSKVSDSDFDFSNTKT